VVSLHVLASVRGCEDGLTRPGVLNCHPAARVVVGGAGGGEPCLHVLTIRSWEGPSLQASTTNRGGCPVEGGLHRG
jgi:hypothetical protein